MAIPSKSSLWGKDWHENIVRDLISPHKFKKLGVTFADHHLRDLLQLPDDKLSYLRYVSPNQDEMANPVSPLDLHKPELSDLTSFSLLPNPFAFGFHNDPLESPSLLAPCGIICDIPIAALQCLPLSAWMY
ncbi:hypothetical protein M378DRAFT_7338 [Amanita muscaria Koide BX008]|uniref:Uncharacterized protein n=1 Tax=Amanita muscaria (strain Koide BX008) TaxID=946122 RepID=A0A0C2XN26_AMAMK|nr:hypothetical protein M378DRAFT_7338 [Amanita muscaria Koide BX008]